MKKTKLLMPILGVTATLGAVVPTMVACGPKAEEVGVGYEIKSSVEGNTIEVISVHAPKVVLGENYTAHFEWKEFSGETKQELSHSYCTKAVGYDAEGNELANVNIFAQAHRSVSVFIPAESVVADMKIELTVQPGQSDNQCKLNKISEVTSYTGTKYSGAVATLDSLKEGDNIIEYEIPLMLLEKASNEDGKTIIGATKIAFWMQREQPTILGELRVAPTDTGYVYLGQDRVSSSWSNYSYALTITMAHPITELEVAEGQIFSYFDFTISPFADLTNGQCCAYCMDALPKQ